MSRKRTLSDLLRDTGLGESSAAHLARAVVKMGVRFPQVLSTTIVNAALVTTAETVICTTPPFSPALDSAPILILCSAVIVPGTTASSLTFRVHQGTTTAGALITSMTGGAYTVPAVAATGVGNTIFGIDLPGIVAGLQYSLTVAQGSATANGAVLTANMALFSL